MDVLEINISKKKLFRQAQLYSYNQTLNDVLRQEIDNTSEILLSENDYNWFLKNLNKADAVIQRKIAHILDHNTMLGELKLKLSQKTDAEAIEDDNMKYIVNISHNLQLYILAEAIEAALIAEVFKYWCSQKNLTHSSEYTQIIDNLHSISLMVNSKCRRPYVMS